MRRWMLFVGVVLVAAPTALPTTYTVNPEGTGDFPTIQAAIDAVVDGDVIELTDGTFTGDGNHNLDFAGKSIAVCSQSGNPESCVIDCGRHEPDAGVHRGFCFQSGEGPECLVRGLTIRNGWASLG
jgi:hypothetical protein